jgi:hypothetical protein
MYVFISPHFPFLFFCGGGGGGEFVKEVSLVIDLQTVDHTSSKNKSQIIKIKSDAI